MLLSSRRCGTDVCDAFAPVLFEAFGFVSKCNAKTISSVDRILGASLHLKQLQLF